MCWPLLLRFFFYQDTVVDLVEDYMGQQLAEQKLAKEHRKKQVEELWRWLRA